MRDLLSERRIITTCGKCCSRKFTSSRSNPVLREGSTVALCQRNYTTLVRIALHWHDYTQLEQQRPQSTFMVSRFVENLSSFLLFLFLSSLRVDHKKVNNYCWINLHSLHSPAAFQMRSLNKNTKTSQMFRCCTL